MVRVATFGHTMITNPNWLLPQEEDPEPYFKHTDVAGKATVTITLPGQDTLVLMEEYHHDGSMETTEYQLEPENPAYSFWMWKPVMTGSRSTPCTGFLIKAVNFGST